MRFIPTYVGHTDWYVNRPLPGTVHPHIRGAYVAAKAHFQVVVRFIPTYVGHTSTGVWARKLKTVHPHIRGAYFLRRLPRRLLRGSSPHTWGILQFRPGREKTARFIPTYVGHTSPCVMQFGVHSVHPHIRGAYAGPKFWTTARQRFIPTYVGHTYSSPISRKPYSVHPHIRGAYPPLSLGTGFSLGSSPHTWGIPHLPHEDGEKRRFIPTYVGHTFGCRQRGAVDPVHPHIRRAYQHPPPAATWQFGSSPHT